MQINIKVIYKVTVSLWVCVTRHAQSTQSKKLTYLCNISKKAWGMKLIFCMQIIMKVDSMYHFGCAQPGIPKVPKIASLQYLFSQEKCEDEVNFLPANTRQRFLQIDAIILGAVARHAQIIQNNKFAISLQYLKKKVW